MNQDAKTPRAGGYAVRRQVFLMGVGCRPPGGNVRHENYLSALEPRVVWLFSVGYRRRNRPAVGCLPVCSNLKHVDGQTPLAERLNVG